MPVRIHESISVAALFEHGQIKPLVFRWKEKKISIDRVSFTWETNEGIVKLLHFSAVAGQTLYELVFNASELTWRLERITAEIS